MEKVSIIVPVYNAEKYICRCVESIINQSYQNLEIILVDDGSTDRSAEILDDFSKKDSRIKAIHKTNGGVSSARNRGLSVASGSYIQFADSDDWLPIDATKLLVETMESDSNDMVIGDFFRVMGKNQSQKGPISKNKRITILEYANLMMKTPANLYFGVLWNKLYKHSIIKKYNITMDENIYNSEDMIFNLEYLLHVSYVYILSNPVYYYSFTPNSLVVKNTNLPKAVEMKKNVFPYYKKFYKEVLGLSNYKKHTLAVYRYLFSISTDSFAFRPPKK